MVLTGGVRTPSDSLVGPVADQAIAVLHFDLLFLGVHGISVEAGLSTPNLAEAETNRRLVQSARRVVVVADHTKWGTVGLSSFASLEQVDTLVTDAGLTAEALCGGVRAPAAAGGGRRIRAARTARGRPGGGRRRLTGAPLPSPSVPVRSVISEELSLWPTVCAQWGGSSRRSHPCVWSSSVQIGQFLRRCSTRWHGT
ncbi:hypothetical protein STENM223S_11029 [Streptomyces tendae]